MLSGSCLCGAVTYEADASVRGIVHCHCQTCRKAHASAFSSLAAIPRDRFRWTGGEDKLSSYESSPGKHRRFCSVCGSQVLAERDGKPVVMLRLGCLDTALEPPPQTHIWRSDGASWYDPSVALPEKAEGL